MSTWDDLATAYAQSFGTLCAGTIDRLLSDTSSGTLLDVGCGTGELAVRAEAVGRAVTAVDAEASMLELARPRIRGRVLQGALPDLPFADDAFDAVTANFVVNHAADPAASVRDLARVARPGGQVAMTIWPAVVASSGEWREVIGSIYAAAGVEPIPSTDLDPSLDFDRSAAGLGDLAERAGLEILVCTDLRWQWRVAPRDLWAGIAGGVAGVGATYLAQTSGTRQRVHDLFTAHADAASGPDGALGFPATAAYVLATAP